MSRPAGRAAAGLLLISWVTLVTFVNAYATFFYTAFFKQMQSEQPGAGILFPSSKQRLFECQVDQTGVPNCMFDLRRRRRSGCGRRGRPLRGVGLHRAGARPQRGARLQRVARDGVITILNN